MKYVYTFTQEDMAEILRQAHVRNDVKVKLGVKDELIGTTDVGIDAHILGLLGEKVFCYFIGKDTTTLDQVAGDDGFDTTMDDGRTVQVKASHYQGGDLICKMKEKLRSDVMVRCFISRDNKWGELEGWIPTTEFIRIQKTKKYGEHGIDTRAVEPQNLHRMDSLFG